VGWFLRPAQGDSSFPTVVYVSEGSSNQITYETSEIGSLTRRGFAICAIDLRGLGNLVPHYPAAGPDFYHGEALREGYPWASFALGKPILGQRVWDYLRCLDYLHSRLDVDQERIHGLGEGGAALAVLLSAALDDRLHAVMLDGPVATYRSLVTSKVYSLEFSWFLYDVLKHFDLPDVVGALVPRRCWIANVRNAQGEAVEESDASSIYEHAMGIYKESNAAGQLRFITFPEHEKSKAITSWLQAA
jgi:pimeloyl-ACP methyl ester carboxylesterase